MRLGLCSCVLQLYVFDFELPESVMILTSDKFYYFGSSSKSAQSHFFAAAIDLSAWHTLTLLLPAVKKLREIENYDLKPAAPSIEVGDDAISSELVGIA